MFGRTEIDGCVANGKPDGFMDFKVPPRNALSRSPPALIYKMYANEVGPMRTPSTDSRGERWWSQDDSVLFRFFFQFSFFFQRKIETSYYSDAENMHVRTGSRTRGRRPDVILKVITRVGILMISKKENVCKIHASKNVFRTPQML